MMSRLLFIVLAFSFLTVKGQLSISQFLKSAPDDPEVKVFRAQESFLRERPYQLSPLQRLEFRTQNRELVNNQQEYAVRITPANPWEVRNNNRYFKSYQSVLSIEHQIALREALTERYVAVIEFLYYQELKGHLLQSRKLARDQIEILRKQSGSSFFDADDFVDLQLDLMETSVDLEEAEFELVNRYHLIEQFYSSRLTDSLAWTTASTISLEGVQRVTDSINYSPAGSLLENYQKQRIELATTEKKLEKANINVGFLQGEYDNRREVQGRTPFNIALGVTIPIVNPNKGDMAKRELDVIEATYELEETKAEVSSWKRIYQDQISRLTQRHATLSKQIEEYEDGGLSGLLSMIEDGDPRVVVQFNGNLIKMKILESKLKRDALLNYIYYLGVTSRLEQQPLRNYLSPTLESIE